ncbi:MAG: hypothetical protein KF770_13450 [Anaerolineae bacterium]|nr:hypothetical protein [Anaerolineae bacterium]
MVSPDPYAQASIKTADNLRSIAHSTAVRDLSQLSLPEIDTAVDAIARLAPAGNVPGVILNGLARLPGRRPPAANVQRDVNLLFKGVEAALDKAAYGAFYAGPAAVMRGYQQLLKLAGKEPETAFPEGVWQFYVQYAGREDSARHTLETGGFDAMLSKHQIALHPVDRITAWLMAAIHLLHQYPDLLANEWRERVYLATLQEVTHALSGGEVAVQPDAAHYANLYPAWEKQRPYGRDRDADPNHNFVTYRRHKFDQFLAEATRHLSAAAYQAWTERLQTMRQALKEYQQQLSIWAYLEPDVYGENRRPLPWEQLHVGLIVQGRYYLIPASDPESGRPSPVTAVREQVAAIYALPTGLTAVKLATLAALKRAVLAELRRSWNQTLTASLTRLQHAPILFNADQRPSHLTLNDIRQTERGLGDHPLTLFDTGQSIVFDQSQIFFDAAWGAALAEIFTREAMSWAVYLRGLPPPTTGDLMIKPLTFPLEAAEQRYIEQSPRLTPEVSAETDQINLSLLQTVRQLCQQRSGWLNLAVTDWLILYRAIHALTYQPDPTLAAEVAALAQTPRYEAAAALAQAAFIAGQAIPAVLIPLDAANSSPRDRLYPLVFEAPLRELDVWGLHGRTLDALAATRQGTLPFAEFDQQRRAYLAALAGFGQILHHAQEISVHGAGARADALQRWATMPTPVLRFLEAMPKQFDPLHNLMQGQELFAHLEPLAANSSLTRFSTAKADSEKRGLAWGVLTDAQGVMRVSLRDFRPHVAALTGIGYKALATRLAQHYLDTYAAGLNDYLRDLRRMAAASREP